MNKLFEGGKFFFGANYWASNAGTDMWKDFRPDTIDRDFEKLTRNGITVLRLFPLWSDFQPIRMHRTYAGDPMEMRLGEKPLPETEAGKAGIDETMADRFGEVLSLAEKHGIRLIVGLVTGWMSGRMFCPPAFEGKGLLTDPEVLRWQIRYVRYIVRRFKDSSAVCAWDLGNECNCMERVTHDQAFVWSTQIANAIRCEDSSRPIVSGMHGLTPTGIWTPEDQGEAVDILCTHPYPLFTPFCDTDPISEMKPILHATAETLLYRDLSGKPAFIEEAGTLGPMVASNEMAGDYIRASAFSAFAHNLYGFLWWCANEQTMLENTPYDWMSVERELGLFDARGKEKPVLRELNRFSAFLKDLSAGKFTDGKPFILSDPITDAVCVLSENQDNWAAAYGSFLLAKQAGLDLTFAWQNDRIPEAKCYLLPSLCGTIGLRRRTVLELIERVKRGANLYLSLDSALLSPFEEITGVRVLSRSRRTEPSFVAIDGKKYR